MRARTKKEILRILQLEDNIYLPLIPQSNRKYIAGVLSGKIKVSRVLTTIHITFENSQLKNIEVSHLAGLK